MVNALQEFKFNDRAIRATIDADGQTWFKASDVCAVLGIQNTAQAVKGLGDEYMYYIYSKDENTGGSAPLMLSEPGLYKLIFNSRRPEAEGFQKWVFTEVLPTIRKYGAYITDNKLDELKANPAQMTRLLNDLSYNKLQLKAAKAKSRRLGDKVEALKAHCAMVEGSFAGIQETLKNVANMVLEYNEKDLAVATETYWSNRATLREWIKPHGLQF